MARVGPDTPETPEPADDNDDLDASQAAADAPPRLEPLPPGATSAAWDPKTGKLISYYDPARDDPARKFHEPVGMELIGRIDRSGPTPVIRPIRRRDPK